MFGYKRIKWTRNKSRWVSDCNNYEIAKDKYVYTALIKVESGGSKWIDDWYYTTQLAKAKKWCDDLRQKQYLHNLQLHINNTSRYGKVGE